MPDLPLDLDALADALAERLACRAVGAESRNGPLGGALPRVRVDGQLFARGPRGSASAGSPTARSPPAPTASLFPRRIWPAPTSPG
jgi:hypothetical protein